MTPIARIISDNGNLAFYSPYDADMLDDFKTRVSSADRKWDGKRKCWLVAPSQLNTLEQLCDQYGLSVVKQLTTLYDAPRVVQKIVRVDYIGAPKYRDDGTVSAYGNTGGEWSVVFPQDVLRNWFEIGLPTAPQMPMTYYAALAVKPAATADEIKKGYRSMAKRWHPDVNRDPDATSMFKRIGEAYAVLSNPQQRRRYDAGLALEASLNKPDRLTTTDAADWRPPVRCGLIMVEATERLGRLIVSSILMWQPIVDARGRELVTSWPAGSDTWLETWV